MKNIFTEHPNSVGESYFKHMLFAIKVGLKLIWLKINFVGSNIKKCRYFLD